MLAVLQERVLNQRSLSQGNLISEQKLCCAEEGCSGLRGGAIQPL